MKKLDLDKLAQPYVGRTDDYIQAIFPRATTAELADPTALVNRVGKFEGRMVYDTTLGQPVWASGAAPADVWETKGAVTDEFYSDVTILGLWDGADEQTTYTTDDQNAQTVTFISGAQLRTNRTPPVTGSTSTLWTTGAGSRVEIPGITATNLNTGGNGVDNDTTIEFFLRAQGPTTFNAGAARIAGRWAGTVNNQWGIVFDASNVILNYRRGDGVEASMSRAWTPANATWYHFAFVKDRQVLRMFVDGVQLGGTDTFAFRTDWNTPTTATPTQIGTYGSSTTAVTQNIDQFRITKQARYTANFTVPTAAFPSS